MTRDRNAGILESLTYFDYTSTCVKILLRYPVFFVIRCRGVLLAVNCKLLYQCCKMVSNIALITLFTPGDQLANQHLFESGSSNCAMSNPLYECNSEVPIMTPCRLYLTLGSVK